MRGVSEVDLVQEVPLGADLAVDPVPTPDLGRGQCHAQDQGHDLDPGVLAEAAVGVQADLEVTVGVRVRFTKRRKQRRSLERIQTVISVILLPLLLADLPRDMVGEG